MQAWAQLLEARSCYPTAKKAASKCLSNCWHSILLIDEKVICNENVTIGDAIEMGHVGNTHLVNIACLVSHLTMKGIVREEVLPWEPHVQQFGDVPSQQFCV